MYNIDNGAVLEIKAQLSYLNVLSFLKCVTFFFFLDAIPASHRLSHWLHPWLHEKPLGAAGGTWHTYLGNSIPRISSSQANHYLISIDWIYCLFFKYYRRHQAHTYIRHFNFYFCNEFQPTVTSSLDVTINLHQPGFILYNFVKYLHFHFKSP